MFSKHDGKPIAHRALAVACHAMAFDAELAWSAELAWYIQHGNGLNASTLGLEVDGLYPGVLGGSVPAGKRATAMTEGTIAAAKSGLSLLYEEGRRAGCPIVDLWAHRQTDAWRRADPGEELWERVGLEHGVQVLGLRVQFARTFAHHSGQKRNGLPIPKRWDPNGVGPY
jgi:hypothetical protein